MRTVLARHSTLTTVPLLFAFLISSGSALPAQEATDADATVTAPETDPAGATTWDDWLVPVGDSIDVSADPIAASCRLWVREVGDGPRAVFLHGGWGAEHGDLLHGFLPLADELRLTFYDQRGSLRSRCDELPTVGDHVADLESLRRALGEDRLVLVGHSKGTWLAMAYAEAYPERVAGLVLMAPVWPTPDAPDIEATNRWERPEVAAELTRHGLVLPRRPEDSPREKSINHRIIFAAVNLHDVTKWREVRSPWTYATDAARSAAESMPEEYDFRPALASLAERGVPIRLVQGDDDYLPAATWAAEVPGVDRVVVEQAGHVLYVDQPESVRELVREFVLGVE